MSKEKEIELTFSKKLSEIKNKKDFFTIKVKEGFMVSKGNSIAFKTDHATSIKRLHDNLGSDNLEYNATLDEYYADLGEYENITVMGNKSAFDFIMNENRKCAVCSKDEINSHGVCMDCGHIHDYTLN